MWKIFIIKLALLIPVAAVYAANGCIDLKTTVETNDCISAQIQNAKKELAKYLKASKHRLASEPKVAEELDKSQKAWLLYRDSHCGAIYQYWIEGSVRGAMAGNCILKQTRRRTHDLWEAYLTFVDTTPPILPEPK